MSTATLPQIISYGHALDMADDRIALMRDSSDAADDVVELRKRFADDGYLYMKGYLDRDQVLEARAALTDRLASAGVLDENHPAIEGIAKPNSGYVFKPEITNGCEPVQRLLYSGRLIEFYKKFYAEDVRHYDYTWLRAIGPGKGTNPHCDLPYMGRGTHKHMTCWLPYGETSYELGGLMVLEGSHKRMDLLEKYVYRDVDAFCENKNADVAKVKEGKWTFTGTLSHNPPAVRNKFGGRWMVTEYEPGDFLTFGMFLVHASLDNQTTNRLRISSDSRYQRASEPIDERWVGVNPPAHGPNGKRGLIC
jgi:ectoine hydroxylase-related dioxygenase (phytanoyl-CoA dioxygenase family)